MEKPKTEQETIEQRAVKYRAKFPSKKACMKRINKTVESFNSKRLKHNINLRVSYNNVIALRDELVKMK